MALQTVRLSFGRESRHFFTLASGVSGYQAERGPSPSLPARRSEHGANLSRTIFLVVEQDGNEPPGVSFAGSAQHPPPLIESRTPRTYPTTSETVASFSCIMCLANVVQLSQVFADVLRSLGSVVGKRAKLDLPLLALLFCLRQSIHFQSSQNDSVHRGNFLSR